MSPVQSRRFRAQPARRRPAKNTKKKSPLASLAGMDTTFLILVGVIIVFGLIMLSSASSVQAYQKTGDSYFYLKHQLLYGVLLGAIAFYVMSTIDYHYWRRQAFTLVIVNIVLLFLVFIPGIGTDFQMGAKQWLSIGGFVFQPSEAVKFTFLIYLAAWLGKQGKDIHDIRYGLGSFLTMLGVLMFIIAIAQNDLGTAIVIAVISIVVYFVAGAPWKHLGIIVLIGIVSFIILVAIAPHRIQRLTVFLHRDTAPKSESYHINQALIAIGSGGPVGVGLGHSRQKFSYLPEVMTDSIFAIIAEELGFLFAAFVVVMFLLLTLQGLRIATRAPDQFGKLLAIGVTTWISFQAFVNIGAMLSVLPLTGIPLPYISYGSSSMIMLLAAAGLLANISRRT